MKFLALIASEIAVLLRLIYTKGLLRSRIEEASLFGILRHCTKLYLFHGAVVHGDHLHTGNGRIWPKITIGVPGDNMRFHRFGGGNFLMSVAMGALNKQDASGRGHFPFLNDNSLFPVHVPKKGRIGECPYPAFLRVICFLLY